MTKTRLLAGSLLAGAAMVALPSAASAQRIDRIVAFGDSYADDGNLFQIIGVDPITTGAYTTGRFSGGSNYIDSVGGRLGVPIDNFAIGGALASGGNTNSGAILPPLGIPGFPTEVGAFLSGGGGVFPSVSGTFDENDLLMVSIGGNDARFYQQNGGSLAGAAAAGQASAAAGSAGLDALVAAGARNISFLAGNTAFLPEVNFDPDPDAFEVRNAYSTAFLADMRQTLGGYAADGVMVHYLDATVITEVVMANMAEFGLVGFACPPDTTCIVSQTTANQYFVYFDQLHATSRGFDIIGQYVLKQLEAPLTIAASSELAMDNARAFGRVLTNRGDVGAPRDGDMSEGLSIFVGGDGFSRNTPITMTQDAMEIRSTGVSAGLQYGFGNGTIGLVGRYSMPQANYVGGSAEAEATSLQIGAFGSFAMGPVFAQGYVGFGSDDHEAEREGVEMIEAIEREADFDGDHVVAGAKLGYLANIGKFRIGPVAALDYATVDVDGYTESGDPALNLIVDDIDYSSLRGSLGLELRGDFAGGGVQVRPYAAFTLEKELDGDGRIFSFSQTTSPEIVNSWDVGDADDSIYTRLAGGFSAQIAGQLRLDVSGTTTFGKDDGNETAANVALKLGF
ncbi:autotransporter domain-containing protein [Sphingomicrobium flavum]|uniref:autotransporter domain-containing protein n=1 Tax=Sphingomicrobium flavum TaxID=1229164 RepID=UPI0021ADD685|nr:autotransporter domain-containing protein [Sphingomicrobium flavum]